MARLSFPHAAFLVLSCVLHLASALPSPNAASTASPSNGMAKPPPPSKDPWYTAPDGYEHAAPGAILKVREAPGLVKAVTNSSAAHNILYRTTDSNYKPAWAVTTLFAPLQGPENSTAGGSTGAPGSMLVSYQTYYDSANVDNGPSYTLYDGAEGDPSISASLGLGWYVSVPDYEGPLGSFTAGVQSGHATIDNVRAVLRCGLGIDHRIARYALWGYSGGALASEWAAELAVQYAPELTFAGVALGGLTPNFTSVMATLNHGAFVYLIVNGLLGLSSQDAAAARVFASQLKASGPYNATAFLAARNDSVTSYRSQYENQDINAYFADGADVFRTPAVAAMLNRDGMMGYHGVPAMPVFAYKAIGDEFSVVADTDALVERYCAVGANILYQRNTVGGHLAELTNGLERSYAFLAAVLGGTYAQKYSRVGCTIQNVTVATVDSPV